MAMSWHPCAGSRLERGQKFIPLLVVAAGLLAYCNSFTVPFILDDIPSIVDNSRIRHLWPMWDALTPLASSLLGGRPVVSFSLALNYALGGLGVWGYHAFNLAVHILAGLTLYGVVRRTLLRPPLRERFGASATQLALAVAVLWTVHPLQTEAVTYVSQRCESLMGLFYLLTLYGFVRGVDSPRRGGWFALSVVACLLGMASKEVMVTAPAMVLLYDRIFISGSFRKAWTRHRRLYLGLAGTWLLLGCLLVGLRYRAVGFGLGLPWWAYALTESRAVVHYLWLALWPHPLVFDYGYGVTIWHDTHPAPYILILAVLAASVLYELRRQPSIGFVGAWFFLILAPASSVIPVAGQAMAEHRMYLPLAAVIAMVSIGGFTLGRGLFHLQEQTRKLLGWGVTVTVALALTILTIQRNYDYRSELSIWQDTVAKCPDNPRAHFNLAQLLTSMGHREEAITQYTEALRFDPQDAVAHYNLANLLAEAGRDSEAISQYSAAARLAPGDARSRINLGNLFLKRARWDDGIAAYTDALRVNPNAFEAHNNLAVALANRGDLVHAAEQFREAARLNPTQPEIHSALAEVLKRLGRHQEAQQELAEARRLSENAGPH